MLRSHPLHINPITQFFLLLDFTIAFAEVEEKEEKKNSFVCFRVYLAQKVHRIKEEKRIDREKKKKFRSYRHSAIYMGQKVVCMHDSKRSRLDVMVFFLSLSLSLCYALLTALSSFPLYSQHQTTTTAKVNDKRRQATKKYVVETAGTLN